MLQQAKSIIENYNNGNISLPEATIKLRELKTEAENTIQSIKDFEYQNLELYDKEPFNGFVFSAVNGKKTYDFSEIEEVTNLKEQLKKAEKKYKTVFEMYQTTGEKPMTEEGELLPIPEIKYSKSYLKITKSK